MEMIYEVKNLNHFAKNLGKMVAKDAGFTQKQLKKYIKVANIKHIIYQHCNGRKHGNLLIDEENTSIVCSEIFNWLLGVDLAAMAANDILDCYWDDNLNEMVFKYKDKNNGKKV
jgi:hypothetical protein